MRLDRAIPDERFSRLVDFAADRGGPPKSFLEYRRNQLELALSLSRVDVKGKRIVEVGGGVSGQAFLLSAIADRVVSTDLLNVTSVYGADFPAAAAIERIAAGRLSFVCGRAEAIPLASAWADVVFSSYVLEHVDDRVAAAREIRRILRPGGHAIILVPNVMETVLRGIWSIAVYRPRQALKWLLIVTGVARAFGRSFRNPPDLRHHTHGTYAGFRDELMGSRSGAWDAILERAGLSIVRRYTLSYEAYLGLFDPGLTLAIQRRLVGLTRRIGTTGPGVWLGPSYGLVARRDDASQTP